MLSVLKNMKQKSKTKSDQLTEKIESELEGR